MSTEESPAIETSLAPPRAGVGLVARRLALALKAARLYPAGHDRVLSSCESLADACKDLLARDGEVVISARPGRIELPEEEPATPDLAGLSEELLRRGIRAVRFQPPLPRETLEGLLTLLQEPPLELEARGGAPAAAGSLEGVALVPLRYHVDRDGSGRPPAGAPGASPGWTPGAGGAGEDLPEDLEEIPEVRSELDRVRSALTAKHANDATSRRTVDSIMRIVLDRICRDDPRDAPPHVPSSVEGGAVWSLEAAEPAGPDDLRLEEFADRIYGIVLAHLHLEAPPPQTWTPGEGAPGVRPVDPLRVRRTCAALEELPPEPEPSQGETMDEGVQSRFLESAVNLLPLCSEDETWNATLGRLARSIEGARSSEERSTGLERVADLLLAADLPTERVGAVMSGLREVGEDDTSFPGALLARLAHYPAQNVHRLAVRLDGETVDRFLRTHLDGVGVSREVMLSLVRASGERVLAMLEESADDADPGHRHRVVETARTIEGPRAVALLERLAADEAERVSLGALRALAERTDEESRDGFDRAFLASPPPVWRMVVQVLRKTGDLRPPRLLETIVRGDDGRRRSLRDRLAALRTLGCLPGASGRHRIVELTRTFRLREPIASCVLQREARRLLRLSPVMGREETL